MATRRLPTPWGGTERNVRPRNKPGTMATDIWEERRMAWERRHTSKHDREDPKPQYRTAVGLALLYAIGFHVEAGRNNR